MDTIGVVLYFAPSSRFMNLYVLRVSVSDDHYEVEYNDDSHRKIFLIFWEISNFSWTEFHIQIVNVPEYSTVASIDSYAIECTRFVGRKSIEYRSWLYVFYRNFPF
jgi:hypothetical protein